MSGSHMCFLNACPQCMSSMCVLNVCPQCISLIFLLKEYCPTCVSSIIVLNECPQCVSSMCVLIITANEFAQVRPHLVQRTLINVIS